MKEMPPHVEQKTPGLDTKNGQPPMGMTLTQSLQTNENPTPPGSLPKKQNLQLDNQKN